MSMPTSMPGMDHSSMSSMSTMSMVMTFGKFGDYKLKVLFDTWDIQTVTQYAFSWIFIVFLVLVLNGIKYVNLVFVETRIKRMTRLLEISAADNHSNNRIVTGKVVEKSNNVFSNMTSKMQPHGWKKLFPLRLLHAVLYAASNGLGLLLMLVVMTYNVGLFWALVLGSFTSDFLFFPWDRIPTHLCKERLSTTTEKMNDNGDDVTVSPLSDQSLS
jgi:hypothetical protein